MLFKVCLCARVLNEIPCFADPCKFVKCTNHYEKCFVEANGSARCKCPSSACPELMEPVCGSDNVTYNSECHMKYRACQDFSPIVVVSQGRCGESRLYHLFNLFSGQGADGVIFLQSLQCERDYFKAEYLNFFFRSWTLHYLSKKIFDKSQVQWLILPIFPSIVWKI